MSATSIATSDYLFEWWDIEKGGWQDAATVKTDDSGKLLWPNVPDTSRSWAYRLRLKDLASVKQL